MIPHSYFTTSDDPAAYNADQTNRQAVTAQFAWEYLCDQRLWLFNESAAEKGFDPWIVVGGMDKLTHPTADRVFILDTRTGQQIVPTDFRLFVQRRDLLQLGLSPGQPGGAKKVVSCS